MIYNIIYFYYYFSSLLRYFELQACLPKVVASHHLKLLDSSVNILFILLVLAEIQKSTRTKNDQ